MENKVFIKREIKISLLENGIEIDRVGREIPSFDEYNFPKGIIIDLYLLMSRNSLVDQWLREQLRALKLYEG